VSTFHYADAPNAFDVTALGYDYGVATAALAHLFEQEGDMSIRESGGVVIGIRK
jgi:hypothetical protein